jgi:uncharacterized membrane protein YoaT (DUF817 family)
MNNKLVAAIASIATFLVIGIVVAIVLIQTSRIKEEEPVVKVPEVPLYKSEMVSPVGNIDFLYYVFDKKRDMGCWVSTTGGVHCMRVGSVNGVAEAGKN